MKKQFNLYLEEKLIEKIREVAASEDRKPSVWITRAIKRYIKEADVK